jgi:hypothetical protein
MLILLGYSFGIKIPPKIFFLSLISTIPFVQYAIYKRFEYFSMDANYTAYFIYLLSMPFFISLLFSERKSKNNFIYISLIFLFNLLSASRGVIVSFFIAIFMICKKKQQIFSSLNIKKIIPFFVLTVILFIYMGKHLVDSVDERIDIYKEISHIRILGLNKNKFNEVHVFPCLAPYNSIENVSMMNNTCIKRNNNPQRPFGFVSLHNTFITWFFLSPFLFFIFYGYLLWRFGQNFIFLSLPTLFLSVGPGLFYLYLGLSIGSSLFEAKS